MKFSANGVPYEVCPICGEMYLPKMFGGSNHLNTHRYSEATRLFRNGMSIINVNNTLSMQGITLFPNIPDKMRNVTKDTVLSFKGDVCRMTGFGSYDTVEILFENKRRTQAFRLWDGYFLANLKIGN